MKHDNWQEYNVGRDPRMLAEYDRLRAEINKLSHTSQPPVDWTLIHRLAETVFEKCGADLQTAACFALARARLYGLTGFTEGCELLANLIVNQWDNFWPPVQQGRVRSDILDWFIARVSGVIRDYAVTNDDKRLIYRCEHALQLISEKLHNTGLNRLPRIENLLYFTEGYTRLFDETDIVVVTKTPAAKNEHSIPPVVRFHTDASTTPAVADLPKGSIIVSHDTRRVRIKIRRRGWLWFLTGSACGILITSLLAFALHYYQQSPQQAQYLLENPFARFPQALTHDDIRQIRTQLSGSTLNQRENQIISHWQQQMTTLSALPPDFICQYTDTLHNTLRRLYPDSLSASSLNNQWQHKQTTLASENTAQTGWLTADGDTEQLINKLLQLEREHKTVTISYLKTSLYELRQHLTRLPPAEIRLYQMEQRRVAGKPLSAAELSQLNDEISALNYRLCRLRHTTQAVSASQEDAS